MKTSTTNPQKRYRIVMLLSNAYNPDDRVRNEALALLDAGYDVIILAWDRKGKKPVHEFLEGIEVYRVRLKAEYGQGLMKWVSYGKLFLVFLGILKKLKPEVLHCHDFDTYLIGIWYSRLITKTKLVLDTHENYYLMLKPLVPNIISLFVQRIEKLFTRFADLEISACEATSQYYKAMGAKKVIVVGNWKDPVHYQFSNDAIYEKRKSIGVDKQKVISYIGSLTSDRNIIPLVKAVRERPEIFLILGGEGGQEQEIKECIQSSPNIYFPGYIHPDDLPLFVAASDIIYYGYDPHHEYAPFNAPNKLYEALAAGKALIAGDLGGELSNIIRKIGCGVLLAEVNDQTVGQAIDRLENENLLIDMQGKSKISGENVYNWHEASSLLKISYSNLFLFLT